MNFEEFKQQLMEDLKEALSRRVGTEIAVEENEVHKLQQESYDGIIIRKQEPVSSPHRFATDSVFCLSLSCTVPRSLPRS